MALHRNLGRLPRFQNTNDVAMAHGGADPFTLSDMPFAQFQRPLYPTPAVRRWVCLLVASLLLHFMLLGWLGGNLRMPVFSSEKPVIITAQLRPAPQPKRIAPPKPAVKPKRRPAPAALPPPVAAIRNSEAATAQNLTAPKFDLAEMSKAFRAMETGISASEEQAGERAESDSPVSAAADPDPQRYKVTIPPSAELKYDVEALRDGQMVYGSGKISWQSEGGNYTVNGEASILFFTLLSFKSTGMIDDFGVAPVLYSEKRFRRPETNTHFHRERNTISFSASTATYPRKGGEQDRASIVWQLTGIGRGAGEKFSPGAELEFFVAGVRDAAPWNVRVVGKEEIEIDSGKVVAWHVVRVPKPGSYDQKLDIWLAPQQEWYPVKLRFTETNGEYLDMLLSDLTMIAAN